MAEVTFRDFAAAIMKGDADAASAALQPLLGLDPAAARAAAQHFQAQFGAAGPAFMAKAMGLRTALAGGAAAGTAVAGDGGVDAELGALLGDCFGLADAPLATAIATLRRRPG
jgi:hypothetical protein